MNKFSKIFLNIFAVILFTTSSAFAAAPGGVSNNLKLWLKADAGIMGSTSISA